MKNVIKNISVIMFLVAGFSLSLSAQTKPAVDHSTHDFSIENSTPIQQTATTTQMIANQITVTNKGEDNIKTRRLKRAEGIKQIGFTDRNGNTLPSATEVNENI